MRVATFSVFLAAWIAATSVLSAQETPPPTPTPTPEPAAEPTAVPAPPPEPAPPAPRPQGGAPQQASNILNPNISVVGNLVGFAGGDPALPDQAFDLSELELALQAAIDPFARADIFIAFTPEGVEVEEGYATFLTLFRNFSLKAGKFRSNFGKFNRIHPPETPFADRPLAAERFFGREGLAAVGFSGSYLLPISFYLNLDAEVTTNWEDAPLFGFLTESGDIEAGGKRSQPSYDFRASTYADFSEQTNGTFGISFAHGKNNGEGTLSSQVVGLDATLRWKDPRRAIYRSFIWQTEAYFTQREEADGTLNAFGMFSYAEYQFARRWRFGLRGDYVDDPSERGALAYVTFWPSEFSAISAQGRIVRRVDGRDEYAAFLKLTFNIGPHGAHPF